MNLKTIFCAVALSMAAPLMTSAAEKAGVNPANLDTSVKPGDDFYDYACGGWIKANPLGDEYARYGSFDVLGEESRKQIKTLFEELTASKHEQGTVAQKVADLYLLGMDSVRLNAEGAAPIKAELDAIKAMKRSDLLATIIRHELAFANPFFSVGVDADLANSDVNALYMSGAGFGMPDRDYYLKTDADNKSIQAAYIKYLESIAQYAGYSKKDAKRMAKNVMKFETEIAKVKKSRAELRDMTKLYNVYTPADLAEMCPQVDWATFLKGMYVGNADRMIVPEPEVLKRSTELYASMTDQEVKDYLAMGVITSACGYLSDDFRTASFDFYSKKLMGTKVQKPRWKKALGVTESYLGEAVGELYVDRYFSKAAKDKMIKIVNDLRVALGEHISKLPWMSDATKVNALLKLNSFTVKVGYPDKWRDYSSITIDPSKSYWENAVGAMVYETKRNLDKLGKPVDKDEWGMTPQTVNAYYNPTTNEICFPAAILQPPFFDVNADDASNYGAIGVVIGHEMTHGFDDQGRNFDQKGNMVNWWKDEDAKQFNALADVLVNQFNKVQVLGDVYCNGSLTLGENIADQGGLRVAYTAFKNTDQGKSNETIDGFTPDQRFYLAYAGVWAANIRDAEKLRLTKVDPHSLGRNRVNITLRNIQPFYDAFGIKAGDAMYVAPEDRVVIW